MTIEQLATAPRSKRAGNWEVEVTTEIETGDTIRSIYHYRTLMLSVRENNQGVSIIHADTGWGSVSDQQGMNQLFGALGLPFYFNRKGGAEIIQRAK